MAPDIALPRSEQARLYNNAKRRALRLLKKELDTSLPEKTLLDNGIAEWQENIHSKA